MDYSLALRLLEEEQRRQEMLILAMEAATRTNSLISAVKQTAHGTADAPAHLGAEAAQLLLPQLGTSFSAAGGIMPPVLDMLRELANQPRSSPADVLHSNAGFGTPTIPARTVAPAAPVAPRTTCAGRNDVQPSVPAVAIAAPLVNHGAMEVDAGRLVPGQTGGQKKDEDEVSEKPHGTRWDMPTPCTVCGRVFATKYQAKKHFMRSHYTGPRRFSCPRCNAKSFAVKEDMTTHLKACGRVFTCSCGMRLRSRPTLKRHCKLTGHTAVSLEGFPIAEPVTTGPSRGAEAQSSDGDYLTSAEPTPEMSARCASTRAPPSHSPLAPMPQLDSRQCLQAPPAVSNTCGASDRSSDASKGEEPLFAQLELPASMH